MKPLKNKTAEQIFSLSLLIGCVALMLFCAIVRLCGVLWFAADLNAVPVPNKFWQEVIKGALLVFELIFVYKILCRTSWGICFIIAVIETLIGVILGETINDEIVSNLFYMACYLIIPIFFVRKWWSIFENALLYGLTMLYGIIFLVGRIGGINDSSAYNFIYNVLGTIDYKLFIVSFYLFIKYFGSINIWKLRIFRKDLKTKSETE